MTIEDLYGIYKSHPIVTTDTRKITGGELFFALKGPSFNGNAFAQQALEQGAAYAVIDEAHYVTSDRTILVDDALKALQALAKQHRQQFNIPFLAITGSNGKTTTKELVHAVLSKKFRTYTTEGNLNNHIGVPLTILKVKDDAELVIVEMGANHQKEIAGYCTYALPTHAMITNCGKAHLEGFGGVEGVRKGKGELYDFIRDNGGTIFMMDDYEYLYQMSQGITKIVRYGTKQGAVVGTVAQSDPFLEVDFAKGLSGRLATQLVGDYNLPNVLAAAAIGNYFGVAQSEIKDAIAAYSPTNSRSQMMHKGSNEIILDAYNANPSSMKAAIENFAAMAADKKVLVLGAMAEMGTDSPAEHQALVDLIRKHQWTDVLLVGKDFETGTHNYNTFTSATEAGEHLRKQNLTNSTLLIKGSRSTGMEKVLQYL